VYATIDLETKVLLDAVVFGRHDTDLAAAFFHHLTQKHDLLTGGVSGRWLRLPDCPLLIRIERLA